LRMGPGFAGGMVAALRHDHVFCDALQIDLAQIGLALVVLPARQAVAGLLPAGHSIRASMPKGTAVSMVVIRSIAVVRPLNIGFPLPVRLHLPAR